MENLDYLFAAYTVIWVFLFGYLVSLHLRQKKIQLELALLKDKLELPSKSR